MSDWKVFFDKPIDDFMAYHHPPLIFFRGIFNGEVIKPLRFEVSILRCGGIIQKMTRKAIITKTILQLHQFIEVEFLRKNRSIRRMLRTATPESAMRLHSEPRLFFSDMRIEVVIRPTISNNKLIVFVCSAFWILEYTWENLVIFNGFVHYRDGFNGLTTDEIVLYYHPIIMTALEGPADSDKIECPFSMRVCIFAALMLKGVSGPYTRRVG